MNVIKRITAVAGTATMVLLGGAALAMPAHAAPEVKAPTVAEAQAKATEFKALVKNQVANQKAAGNTAESKADRKAAIQAWLDENRRGITAPVVEAPIEITEPAPTDGVVGPIEGIPTRPPVIIGG